MMVLFLRLPLWKQISTQQCFALSTVYCHSLSFSSFVSVSYNSLMYWGCSSSGAWFVVTHIGKRQCSGRVPKQPRRKRRNIRPSDHYWCGGVEQQIGLSLGPLQRPVVVLQRHNRLTKATADRYSKCSTDHEWRWFLTGDQIKMLLSKSCCCSSCGLVDWAWHGVHVAA